MIADNIASVLDALYDSVDFAEEGEDFALADTDRETAVAESNGRYWAEVNAARSEVGELNWVGLLHQASETALGETDPNLKTDRLLELAATAIVFAASVQRQTDAFNADPKASKAKAKGAE